MYDAGTVTSNSLIMDAWIMKNITMTNPFIDFFIIYGQTKKTFTSPRIEMIQAAKNSIFSYHTSYEHEAVPMHIILNNAQILNSEVLRMFNF